eukprot:TRINITY_DN1981_c0_g1_i2.p1 TRINITY_DN1981_c0_g1~~TRINITY_DN1981_c0_g1_i2.p1  ORF type:complete len:117 (-),score=24.24 TRINITY_DN1981_c0_g1_i2:425-775(-)
MTLKTGVRYRKLNQSCDDEVDHGINTSPEQFDRPPAKIPWKAILYAMVLFLLGTFLLTIGLLVVTGHIVDTHYQERFWPLVILGLLMFIPGSYHTYFAYKAFKGDPDWNFEEFPDF